MSKSDSDDGAPAMDAGTTAATRIDTAHVLAEVESLSGDAVDRPAQRPQAVAALPPVAAEPQGPGAPVHQLRHQAAQLAEYLRRRQKDLDHRQSQLNAQLAQQEKHARAARMSLAERAAEQDERQRQLEAAEAEQDRARKEAEEVLAGREEELRAAEHRLRKRSDALDRRKEVLGQRERQLEVLAARNRESIDDDLAKRERELEAVAAEQTKAEEALRYQKQRIDAHRQASQQLVRQMLDGLERRRQAVEAGGAKLIEKARQPSPELLEREEQVRQTTRVLEAKQRALDEAETLLATARAEVDGLRDQLAEDRRRLREEARAERQRMATEHRRALAELDKKRQSLARRSEHVDQCRLALEQMRSDLGRMHRETLEVRLAIEELWIQLSGSAPAAALTTSLGQIRAKLAEHYRTADSELAERREELEGLRSQLTDEYEKLVRKKEEVQQWAAQRQQEVEEQAQRLLAREQELDRQQTAFHDLARQWQSEQLGLQQEIRRLKTRLVEPQAALTPA